MKWETVGGVDVEIDWELWAQSQPNGVLNADVLEAEKWDRGLHQKVCETKLMLFILDWEGYWYNNRKEEDQIGRKPQCWAANKKRQRQDELPWLKGV